MQYSAATLATATHYVEQVPLPYVEQVPLPSASVAASGTPDSYLPSASQIRADMGGTEIYAPLQSIFASGLVAGYSRQIFVLTDGEVGPHTLRIKLFISAFFVIYCEPL